MFQIRPPLGGFPLPRDSLALLSTWRRWGGAALGLVSPTTHNSSPFSTLICKLAGGVQNKETTPRIDMCIVRHGIAHRYMCIVQCALCITLLQLWHDWQTKVGSSCWYLHINRKTPIGPAALTLSYSLGLRGIVCNMSYILILTLGVLFIPTSKNHKNSSSAKLMLPIHAPASVGIVE